MTVVYDPDASFWLTLPRWTGTAVGPVLLSSLFWFFMFMHAVLLALDRVYPAWLCRDGSRERTPYVRTPTALMSACTVFPIWTGGPQVLTSLMTFFIVFYGNQSYTRFMQFWDFCVSLGGLTMDWATLVRTHLPDEPTVPYVAVQSPRSAASSISPSTALDDQQPRERGQKDGPQLNTTVLRVVSTVDDL